MEKTITIQGTKAPKGRQATFILSTEDIDRDGDVILVGGWKTSEFMKNPVFQIFHDGRQFPIGKFLRVYKHSKQLRGEVQFSDQGTNPTADLAYELVQQDIMRAVSVGFRSNDFEPNDSGGYTYKSADLMEVSLVNVPANQNALILAKSFDAETKSVIFKDYDPNAEEESEEKQDEDVSAEPEQTEEDPFAMSEETYDRIQEILGG